MEHRPRSKVLEIIEEQPGLNISEITERLDISRSATRYHLRRLKGHVTTIRQGNQVLHFATSMQPKQRQAVALLRIGSIRSLVETLVEDPMVKPSEVAKDLGLSTRSVRRSIRMLTHAGLAHDEPADNQKGFRRIALHPDTRVAWVLWCKGAEDEYHISSLRKAPGWVIAIELMLGQLGPGWFY